MSHILETLSRTIMAKFDLTTEDGLLQWLHKSNYEEGTHAIKVERLLGGAAGFVYRAHLEDVASKSIIVKHAEPYAARAQHFKLDQNRMVPVR